jgi:hypothetical protein
MLINPSITFAVKRTSLHDDGMSVDVAETTQAGRR